MSDSTPNPELLRSLGQLARGLSALFWGLPLAIILGFHATRADVYAVIALAAMWFTIGVQLFGLHMLDHFQKQERPWRLALDRAKLPALVSLGLSPFLYWWGRMPEQMFFGWAVALLGLTGVIYLFNLNHVVERLG